MSELTQGVSDGFLQLQLHDCTIALTRRGSCKGAVWCCDGARTDSEAVRIPRGARMAYYHHLHEQHQICHRRVSSVRFPGNLRRWLIACLLPPRFLFLLQQLPSHTSPVLIAPIRFLRFLSIVANALSSLIQRVVPRLAVDSISIAAILWTLPHQRLRFFGGSSSHRFPHSRRQYSRCRAFSVRRARMGCFRSVLSWLRTALSRSRSSRSPTIVRVRYLIPKWEHDADPTVGLPYRLPQGELRPRPALG